MPLRSTTGSIATVRAAELRQGYAVYRRMLDDTDTFRNGVLAYLGLDHCSSSNGYLASAPQVMAEAVGAEQAFSTCGSSLSVKVAVLAATRGTGVILIGWDAHSPSLQS